MLSHGKTEHVYAYDAARRKIRRALQRGTVWTNFRIAMRALWEGITG